MSDLITSAYDGVPMTVDSVLKDPRWLPERVIDHLGGAFLEDLILRDAGQSDAGMAVYTESAAPFLADAAEGVAEFAEIPVSAPTGGTVKKVVASKSALGIRVSYEQRTENKLDEVNRQATALQNTMIRGGIRETLAAFDAANVPTVGAAAPWTNDGADVVRDLIDGIEQIEEETVDGDDDQPYGYSPDTIVLHTSTATRLFANEQVQKFYRGDIAGENPLYKGVLPVTFNGLTVAASRFFPKDRVVLMERGTVGFRSDTIPLSMTPFYCPGGETSFGGPTMSWRADSVRKRILAVDNPKAALVITGVR